MNLFKSKKGSIEKPWLKLYKDKGIPENLDYPECSMFELIENSSIKYPNNIAYDYFGSTCTYKNFIDKIHEVAKALKAQKIKENDIVTICMPNTPQAIITFYAVNLIGAIANVVHPLSGEKEIENYLTTTNSSLILTIDIAYKKVANVVKNTKVKKVIVTTAADEMRFLTSILYWIFKGKKVEIANSKKILKWKEFVDLGKDYKGIYRVRRKSSNPAVILYSGGTTGSPKGILLSNMNFNALALQSYYSVGSCEAGDSILAIMPIFHGFGLGESIHAPLSFGMKCILIPAFKAAEFDRLIKKYKPNFIIGVPTLFEALLKYGKFKEGSLSFIKNFMSGGDVISNETKKKIDKLLLKNGAKTTLRIGYGLTEGTCASCLTQDNVKYESGSIGIPFPDTIYKIVKIGTHDEVPYDTDGEICINGPTVMMGYYNDAKETAQILRVHADGKTWLHTGDVGCMRKDGVIIFKQRIKRIIISSGYNIYPSYIENVINSHTAVLTSTVIGIDHPYKVQVAKAYIVLKNKPQDLKKVKKSIQAHCEKYIAKYSLPYSYEFRDSLPKTLIGKVNFNELIEEEKNKSK